MGTKLIVLTFLTFFIFHSANGQYLEGNISYSWEAPQKVIFNGPIRPVISLGDKVSLTITGNADLRPYEVEKKRGGFLGIGRQRYREVVHDFKNADALQIATVIAGTSHKVSTRQTTRVIQVSMSSFEMGSFFDCMKLELPLLGYLDEPNKNLVLGSANLTIRMEIDSKERILHILKFIKDYRPTEFLAIRELLEVGNVMKQYPNELCDEIFKLYQNQQREIFQRIKIDLLEYMLLKSPNNSTIRVKLAQSYLEDENFAAAKLNAKTEIARLKALDQTTIKMEDRLLLADCYIVLAEATGQQAMGTQMNAFQVSISFMKLAGDQLVAAGHTQTPKYRDLILKQVKAFQRIGTESALLEASEILEKSLINLK